MRTDALTQSGTLLQSASRSCHSKGGYAMKIANVIPAALMTCALFLLAIAPTAFATESAGEIVANQQKLRSLVELGEGKYASLKPGEKSRVLKLQDEIFDILDNAPSVSAMPADKRDELDSAQAQIASIGDGLDPAAGQRTVRCSYQARIGSNRKEKVCRDIHSSGDADGRAKLRRLGSCRGLQNCSGANPGGP